MYSSFQHSIQVLRRASLSVSCALLVTASLSAQSVLSGHWEDDTTLGPTLKLFVAPPPLGSPTGSGDATSPFDRVTRAVDLAKLLHQHPSVAIPGVTPLPIRITINVAPGVYQNDPFQPTNLTFGEVFPWQVPAHGINIEPWPIGGGSSAARPVVTMHIPFGGPALPNDPNLAPVLCDWVGHEVDPAGNALPASVIRGLEFDESYRGIWLEPSLATAPMPAFSIDPVAVEVRECLFRRVDFPIRIRTAEGLAAAHVIEDNDVGTEEMIAKWAIFEENFGVSSTLYRSNRIQFYEFGIRVEGVAGSTRTTVPRLFSNFIQISEGLVELLDCDPYVVNNTLAFAVDFSSNPSVSGLTWTGTRLSFANNIVWCPIGGGVASAVDLRFNGSAITSSAALAASSGVTQSNNLIEDFNGGVRPRFVGGDTYPGVNAVDLHLLDVSPMIEAGNTQAAMDVASGLTFRTHSIGSTMTVRTDISVDNDLDNRLFLSGVAPGPAARVDIGGDEHLVRHDATGKPECRIEVPNSVLQDSFGNVRTVQPSTAPGTARTWRLDLELSGPPNGVFLLLNGFVYEATLPPLSIPNDALYQNFVLGPVLGLASLGNVTIDLLGQVLVTSGTFDSLGLASLGGLVLPATQLADEELEWTFQMFTADPATGRWAASNRIRVDLSNS